MSETPRLSSLLTDVVAAHPGERLFPADLMDALQDRAIGAMLLLFAIVNLLPLPPGVSTVTGIPLVLVAAQMVVGRTRPWLPQVIMRRSVSKGQALAGIAHLERYERWIGKITRPRVPQLTGHTGARVIGLISLLLGIIICLPIPLGNHLPALAASFYGMALVNRDGATAILGTGVAVGAVAVVSSVVGGLFAAARYAFAELL